MHCRSGPRGMILPLGLALLHEDRDILVVDKPPGLLTIGTERERERTAYRILTDYVRKGCARARNRVFIVHRLDRESSGLLVFAKSEEAKHRLQGGWDEVKKRYLAVVHGRFGKPSGVITSYLAENKARIVRSTTDRRWGKLSHTAYRVLREARGLSLLEVDLLTGRKHQIRVHMAEAGHPIVGDRKYGQENDAHRRLALHAQSICFRHPFSGAPLSFSTEMPAYFAALLGEAARGDSHRS